MPMRLDEGWNQIQFNLSDFTRRAYGTNYVETLRVQIHANCRIRRIYFSDRLYTEQELPAEYKLFLPVMKSSPLSSPPGPMLEQDGSEYEQEPNDDDPQEFTDDQYQENQPHATFESESQEVECVT
jgi:hypothetical protein